jgi:hypothetical protein
MDASLTFMPLYSRRKSPCIYWIGAIGGWVGLVLGLDTVEKRKVFPPAVTGTPISGRPACNIVPTLTEITWHPNLYTYVNK